MKEATRTLIVRTRASAWLAILIWGIAATMMHPTFASLLALSFIAGLLALLRWIARLEGRGDLA